MFKSSFACRPMRKHKIMQVLIIVVIGTDQFVYNTRASIRTRIIEIISNSSRRTFEHKICVFSITCLYFNIVFDVTASTTILKNETKNRVERQRYYAVCICVRYYNLYTAATRGARKSYKIYKGEVGCKEGYARKTMTTEDELLCEEGRTL